MTIGSIFLIISISIITIWLIILIKKLRHKIFAIFLIILIIFAYLSFTIIQNERQIEIKQPGDLIATSKLYFSWIASLSTNIKTITFNAIKIDSNKSENKTKS